MPIRPASHSGQWYSGDSETLCSELEQWLDMNIPNSDFDPSSLKALIVPHAGYRFSGIVSASGYAYLKRTSPKLVIILGPSHYKLLRNSCGLSEFSFINTPIGDLEIDTNLTEKLIRTDNDIFAKITQEDDVKEHSIEMQFPFLFKIYGGRDIKILPIQVGYFSDGQKRRKAAEILKNLLSPLPSEDVFFVVSSDFCHYGNRFNYSPSFRDSNISKNEHISILDREGFDTLNKPNPIEGFRSYLEKTGNTICGRESILLFLEILDQANIKGIWEPIDYAQSNLLNSSNDSSVSYLSAIFKKNSNKTPVENDGG